ncbi:hypothetical protein M9H77_34916 [Catharanthus roseus]|uniref:Uncharacterized protein n=1 Tax=Catharanthus roseus TaxID=4058 RepID=A0ACB9ZQ37_CATRO|nr:hypothetical protein M9H77_34916 [Catharanthus roseus]
MFDPFCYGFGNLDDTSLIELNTVNFALEFDRNSPQHVCTITSTRGRRYTMEFKGQGKNVGGKLILCHGDLTMKETLNDSIFQKTKSCVKIENQSLGAALLYSLTFKEFLDELIFKRELKMLMLTLSLIYKNSILSIVDGMTRDVQETIELLQGRVTRAIARRIEEEHRGKIAIFEKMIQDLVGKIHGNGAHVLVANKGRQLAKTWNDTSLRKYYP